MRRRERVAVPAVVAFLVVCSLVSGCLPVVRRIEPDGPRGPTLVLVVTNRSPDAIDIGHEFESEGFGGGGEGQIEACSGSAVEFGEVAGAVSIVVGGEEVSAVTIPRAVGPGQFVIYRVDVAPDGMASSVGPQVADRAPAAPPARIPGCR